VETTWKIVFDLSHITGWRSWSMWVLSRLVREELSRSMDWEVGWSNRRRHFRHA